MRLAVAALCAAAAFAAPAQAGPPVDVQINGPVECVQEPCDQPALVVVCVGTVKPCLEVDYDG